MVSQGGQHAQLQSVGFFYVHYDIQVLDGEFKTIVPIIAIWLSTHAKRLDHQLAPRHLDVAA